MLDTSTKRRIDDCRDILVGKLPDSKAQIEQITIGLIYKFMDDMDKETIELGGQTKFFYGNPPFAAIQLLKVCLFSKVFVNRKRFGKSHKFPEPVEAMIFRPH